MNTQAHEEQAARMSHDATMCALVSEFDPAVKKSCMCVSIALGVASTNMDKEAMDKINAELKPMLERMNLELKAYATERGIAYSGAAAARLGFAAFPDDEKRAEFAEKVLPILTLKEVLETIDDGEGSFEA